MQWLDHHGVDWPNAGIDCAGRRGDLATLARRVDAGDRMGWAMRLAAADGQTDAVALLLDAGVTPSGRALAAGIRSEAPGLVALLEPTASLGSSSNDSASVFPVVAATEVGDHASLERLLLRGAPAGPALRWAAWNGDLTAAALVLPHSDRYAVGAARAAAAYRQDARMSRLVAAYLPDTLDLPQRRWAARPTPPPLITAVRQRRDVHPPREAPPCYPDNPFCPAGGPPVERIENARSILTDGADVHQTHAPQGWDALMTAAAAGHAEYVPLLLSAGADPSRTDVFGRTAADLARRYGHDEVLQALPRSAR